MFNIVLYSPQIPQNTGNIARTCAVTGCRLHLIKPYGFIINDKTLRRAGLDYWHDVDVLEYSSFEDFERANPKAEIYLLTSHADKFFTECRYNPDDFFVFGSETAGLPDFIHEKYPDNRIRIPMRPNERCLNLSNSVAVMVYEAFRQNGFKDFI